MMYFSQYAHPWAVTGPNGQLVSSYIASFLNPFALHFALFFHVMMCGSCSLQALNMTTTKQSATVVQINNCGHNCSSQIIICSVNGRQYVTTCEL